MPGWPFTVAISACYFGAMFLAGTAWGEAGADLAGILLLPVCLVASACAGDCLGRRDLKATEPALSAASLRS